MGNETTNVDHEYDISMIALTRGEKEFKVVRIEKDGKQILMANQVSEARKHLAQYGAFDIPAFKDTSKDRAKLAAKRAAEKAGQTKIEDSDRRF